ncbi:choice-of-anchor A family protein [Glycomyces sp. NRRL B-16210]|uniref:choice-of-anchor A family protein n=1 Tax=Glycomyces sp. NRRL B-16210 TaxID=1463821 RepID=UPI00068E3530|nr:choice-of-anchor A family protein [Glycomyces sp. NRRL B-16210]
MAVAAVAVALAGTTQHAQAATVTIDPLAPAFDFNAFVENETTLASLEAEGAIATGGNLVVEGSYNVMIHDVGTFVAPGDSAPSALVVGGRMDYTADPATSVVQVLNQGYVKIGDLTGTDVLNTDDNSASVNTRVVAAGAGYDSTPRLQLTVQQPLDSVGPSSPIDFAGAFAELRSTSATLAGCQGTVAMMDVGGTAVAEGEVAPGQIIEISLEPGTTNVLDLTGEDLDNMSELRFLDQPTLDTPLLINVDTSGASGELDWDVAPQSPISGDQSPFILWNFGDTSRLRIASGDTVQGSILAPYADYSDVSPTNVEGQIIARNASLGEIGENGGEIHHFPFASTLTCESDVEPSPSPSEPDPSGDGPTGGASDGPTDGGADLPSTGQSLQPLLIAAGALVAVGAAVLVGATRRRRTQP